MAGDADDEIPETGAVFTFGKSKFADNVPSKFWLKNDVPIKLACGDEHTSLITENGKLFMFGSNNWGQLGLGEKISVNKPTCVKALKSEKVKLVACGRTHTLVYTSSSNLYAAGGNNEGQLGLGDFVDRTSFQLVEFFTKRGPIKMLAAGSNTSAAITQDGALFTFGERDGGKLGLSTSQAPNHRVPQQVEGISDPVLQVACGGGHTLALTEKNLYSFGLGQFGQLGHGTFTFESRLPKEVEHFRKGRVKHIACGENHSAVLTGCGSKPSAGIQVFGRSLETLWFLLAFGTSMMGPRAGRHLQQFHPTFSCLWEGIGHMVGLGRHWKAECTETECGLLYTFGDGRHGKLALGDEYFANQFKPTLCPRFLKNNVQAVTCGGCHMVVLAKPRLRRSEVVILEENDVTEDHLEKLLREAESRHSLNRSLSARDRRRERERSPEQFGMMFRTLPPLSSGHLNVSLPASSQTFPSQLKQRTTNGFQRNGLLSSTGKVSEEHEEEAKTLVENYEDNESVKNLGETVDLLNLTHVMKMDPAEKTITLCPVQKISNRKTIEFSDDETTGEEEQTEEEDEEEDEEEEEEGNDVKEHCENKENKELVEKTKQQESSVIPPTPQDDIEEAPVPDGPNKHSEENDTSSPLIKEKLNQNEAKQDKPKGLFGSNSKISLFKRRSSTKKEKSEAPVEESSPAEKASSSDNGDTEHNSRVKASHSLPHRSRSATCILL
ncbi:retinitis pigmentosa GTPase regulator b isoform X2 [Tachysurus fulvidraco]|uniref:retinitis pigmentosa GTPase regulator b isoform X2 n=1 Tax=Tachysurus fulvidraco TaxID=1234273 RepID=UPI000F4E4935|nr:retinitis pigmentosa GTPase regulator b isoform X2 [Tachysurus fulvidraco]